MHISCNSCSSPDIHSAGCMPAAPNPSFTRTSRAGNEGRTLRAGNHNPRRNSTSFFLLSHTGESQPRAQNTAQRGCLPLQTSNGGLAGQNSSVSRPGCALSASTLPSAGAEPPPPLPTVGHEPYRHTNRIIFSSILSPALSLLGGYLDLASLQFVQMGTRISPLSLRPTSQ